MTLIQECCKITVVCFCTFDPLDRAEEEGWGMDFWTACIFVQVLVTYLNGLDFYFFFFNFIYLHLSNA